jgi:hypothetical protein
MKKIIAVLCAMHSLSTIAAQDAQDFGFKEYTLGKVKSELNLKEKNFTCKPTNDYELCMKVGDKVTETIAGAKLTAIGLKVSDGRIIQVYLKLNTSDYEQVKSAFSVKYGKPFEITDETLQNGFGAKYVSESAKWKQGNSTVGIKQRSGKIDESAILYSFDKSISDTLKKQEINATKNASDM